MMGFVYICKIEYNDAHDNVWGYQDHETEEILTQLEGSMKESDVESWKEFYESENKDFQTLSYPNVKCDVFGLPYVEDF